METGINPSLLPFGRDVLNSMEIKFDFDGGIVERQELLNGTETITIEGSSNDGAWSLTLCFSRNRGLAETTREGDITVVDQRNGLELWGSLERVVEVHREETDWAANIAFGIDRGAMAGGGLDERINVYLEAASDSVRGHVEARARENIA